MISCNELMIGNRVLVNEQLREVSAITGTTIVTTGDEAEAEPLTLELEKVNVKPVPLTDDILKDCGFVFHPYFKFWQLVTKDNYSEMDINTDYDIIDFMRKAVVKKLTSLHQLQNLYFLLKGRELQIGHPAGRL